MNSSASPLPTETQGYDFCWHCVCKDTALRDLLGILNSIKPLDALSQKRVTRMKSTIMAALHGVEIEPGQHVCEECGTVHETLRHGAQND